MKRSLVMAVCGALVLSASPAFAQKAVKKPASSKKPAATKTEPQPAAPAAQPAPQSEPATSAPGAISGNSAAPLSEGERPWAKGVSQQKRDTAWELFRQGNALLKDSVFSQAAAKYREAISHWDHPAIHYNLVLALLNMDQPIEVHHHLEKAMRYGPAPLDQDKFEQARAYKNLVEKQLARVTITCAVEGANVMMDGRPLFVGPGQYSGWVRAGPHAIVASREGYLTNETSRAFAPGEVASMDLKLFRTEDLTRYKRRWSVWVPWSVVAGGAALAITGGALHMNARDDFRAYDEGIDACGGCVPSADLRARVERGNNMQNLAIGGYALGAAAITTGAVLVYMNRLEPYRVTTEELQLESVSVAPILAPGASGMSATVRF